MKILVNITRGLTQGKVILLFSFDGDPPPYSSIHAAAIIFKTTVDGIAQYQQFMQDIQYVWEIMVVN